MIEDQDLPAPASAARPGEEPGELEEAGGGPPSPGPEGPGERAAPAVLKRVLVNVSDPEEARVAVLWDGRLEEIYFERAAEKKHLGNIYKGRVVNLEPAIQAAFVDLGTGRNGFLHASDVLPAYAGAAAGIPFESLSRRPQAPRRPRIQDLLVKGQDVLVQISKDSIGQKGPTLTTCISLPGQYLVLMPGVSRYGVSKRIQDGEERTKLRQCLARLDPPRGLGCIVRTAGLNRSTEELERDLGQLMAAWGAVGERAAASRAPALILEECDLVTRVLRDLLASDIHEVVLDGEEVYRRAREYLARSLPALEKRVRLHDSTVPLFTRYGIEEEIEKIYNRKVPLPSGGYLVIDETEALVAIDVNSGRYRDEEDLEATALRTNIEAAREIARQLRLRDLGGVIVNDFIDMEVEANRREVERTLKEALRRDRARSWISRISRFGIIEMTRQRVRPSFERAHHETCKHCHGRGVVKSARSTAAEVLRQLRAGLSQKKRETAEVLIHPAVHEYLMNDRRRQIVELEDEFQKTVVFLSDPQAGADQIKIRYR